MCVHNTYTFARFTSKSFSFWDNLCDMTCVFPKLDFPPLILEYCDDDVDNKGWCYIYRIQAVMPWYLHVYQNFLFPKPHPISIWFDFIIYLCTIWKNHSRLMISSMCCSASIALNSSSYHASVLAPETLTIWKKSPKMALWMGKKMKKKYYSIELQ